MDWRWWGAFVGGMITSQQPLLIVVLITAVASLGLAVAGHANQWLTTAGVLLAFAGLIQSRVSKLFLENSRHFWNKKKFPHGPPSFWMSKVTMDDDPRWSAEMRRALFRAPQVGDYLIGAGCILELIAVWAP